MSAQAAGAPSVPLSHDIAIGSPAGVVVTSPSPENRGGYLHILKSTALVGGASALNILFGIIRTKVTAVLLGPSGMGIWGLYNSINDLAFSLAGMGVQSSAVRQIAEAVGSGDQLRVERTVLVLRRLVLVLGISGATLLVLGSSQISAITFGTTERKAGVALIAAAVFLRLLGAGQAGLLQGLRRVSDMARMSVVAGVVGTISVVPFIYFLREQGIVPAILVSTGLGTLVSWWYCRRLVARPASLPLAEFLEESGALLKLGFAFLASGFVMMGTAYVVRIIITQTIGFAATGLYQSAWTLCGLYVGFILQAMGADFYPRLTAAAHDNEETNRLVNEQARIALLIGAPGAMVTLTLAPLVIFVFYSGSFAAAVGLLRWLCLGVALRLVIWPMGFIPIAKARQLAFMTTDSVWAACNVALTWLLVRRFGLDGAGMAFLGAYVVNGIVVYALVRRLSGFQWSAENKRLLSVFVPAIGGVFVIVMMLPFYLATAIGAVISLVTGILALRSLLSLVPHDRLPPVVRVLCTRLRFIPA